MLVIIFGIVERSSAEEMSFQMLPEVGFRWGGGSPHRDGLRRAGLLFLLLFAGLELSHPAAGLLQFSDHLLHDSAAHGGTPADREVVLDDHGPFVLASAPLLQPPSPRRWLLLPPDYSPESPFLSVPSHVPIRSCV